MSDGTALRIFLVEDESIVAMMVEDMLADLGHTVAASAASLEDGMIHAISGEFDMALLDVNLNGRHSTPIAEVVAGRRLPFLLMTGYRLSLPALMTRAPVLHKPFTMAEMDAALRQLASGRQ